jgi:deoxyribodipyrimidine photolyase
MKRPYLDEMHDEIDRLRAQNVALVAALQQALEVIEYCAMPPGTLHPANNAQWMRAQNSLNDLRAALAEVK